MHDKDVINKLKNIPNDLGDTLNTINREIGYGTKIVRESKDDNDIYTVIKEYNNNDVLIKVSTLSNMNETNNYLTQTIDYYRESGVLDYSEIFNILYDEDSKIVSIEKQ